jgi:hypothetical protein
MWTPPSPLRYADVHVARVAVRACACLDVLSRLGTLYAQWRTKGVCACLLEGRLRG